MRRRIVVPTPSSTPERRRTSAATYGDASGAASTRRRFFRGQLRLMSQRDARILRQILRLSGSQKWRILAATCLMLLNSFAQLSVPRALGGVVDNLSGAQDPGEFNRAVIVVVVSRLIQSITAAMRRYHFMVAGELLVNHVREGLLQSILLEDVSLHDTTQTGELVNRITEDTAKLRTAATSLMPNFFKNTTVALYGVINLWLLSPKLTVTMVSTVPLVLFMAKLYGQKVRKLNMDFSDLRAEATSIATECISNIRTVKAFGAEMASVQRFADTSREAHILRRRFLMVHCGVVQFNVLLFGLGLAGMMYIGGWEVLSGTMTTGMLTSFMFYTNAIAEEVTNILNHYSELMGCLGSSDKVLDLLHDVKIPEGRWLPQPPQRIEFQNVFFSYPIRHEADVLKNFSLVVKRGEITALVGPSGGGKSSIVNLLLKFYEPREGSILFDGIDSSSLHPWSIRKNIGVVSQEPILFSDTIRNNIMYGWRSSENSNKEVTDADVVRAAEQSHAHEFISAFPEGYDTLVGERGVALSGGQKQRIALARALISHPALLILDEATSALDSESEHQVQLALDELISQPESSSQAILVIAHRLSTIKRADCICVIGNGGIIESGTHDELLQLRGAYSGLVARQLS